jgi:hypothetical protein
MKQLELARSHTIPGWNDDFAIKVLVCIPTEDGWEQEKI